MDEKQPVRIVFFLDLSQTRIVAPPVGLLPSLLEVVALANVRPCLAYDGSKLIDAFIDAPSSFSAFRDRWLLPGNSGVCGSLPVGHDRECKGVQDCGVHCRVPRRGDRIGRRSGESLVEVQSHTRITGACE